MCVYVTLLSHMITTKSYAVILKRWTRSIFIKHHQTCLKCNKICLTRVTHDQTLLSYKV